jgi:hypothetical protein
MAVSSPEEARATGSKTNYKMTVKQYQKSLADEWQMLALRLQSINGACCHVLCRLTPAASSTVTKR